MHGHGQVAVGITRSNMPMTMRVVAVHGLLMRFRLYTTNDRDVAGLEERVTSDLMMSFLGT